MAGTKALDRSTYRQIVARLKRGDSRRRVVEDLQLPESIIGKVSVHAGVAKPRSKTNRDKDVAIVEAWLAAAAPKKRAAKSQQAESEARAAKVAKEQIARASARSRKGHTAEALIRSTPPGGPEGRTLGASVMFEVMVNGRRRLVERKGPLADHRARRLRAPVEVDVGRGGLRTT